MSKHSGGDSEFPCYVAQPESDAKAAIIVIQEIFGVNSGNQGKMRSLGQLGLSRHCARPVLADQ